MNLSEPRKADRTVSIRERALSLTSGNQRSVTKLSSRSRLTLRVDGVTSNRAVDEAYLSILLQPLGCAPGMVCDSKSIRLEATT